MNDELNNALDDLLEQNSRQRSDPYRAEIKLKECEAGRRILAFPIEWRAALVELLVEKRIEQDRKIAELQASSANGHVNLVEVAGGFEIWWPARVLISALDEVLRTKPPVNCERLRMLLDWIATAKFANDSWYPIMPVAKLVEGVIRSDSASHEMRQSMAGFVASVRRSSWDKRTRHLAMRLERLLGGQERNPVILGEAWSDAALADLQLREPDLRGNWFRLLQHCESGSASVPSPKWSKQAMELIDQVGIDDFRERLRHWFPLIDKPRTQPITDWNREWQPDPNQLIIEPHADILKGLAWCCGLREDKELARALTTLALSSYRKVPKIGPRLVKVGNACVIALGMMPWMEGVYQLALLKVKVKFGTAQKVIEKALNAAAERVKIPRADLEEMAVPAYGLTDVGICQEPVGDFTARLTVTTAGTELAWMKADGKLQKGVPAAVKQQSADELKELKAAAKDIERMLPAQKERIDNLFLQQKSWPFAVWRERYLDHPLVGVIARRLLWVFTTNGRPVTGIWFEGRLVDVDLQPLAPSAGTTVELWHPIGRELAEVLGWRAWLDAQHVQQPFKQAHREVYLLTDAERHTRTYSNRFAGHVLKQHQFNALCAARGWKNKLRLMVDAEFPPAAKELPQWGLRAEYWIEGAGEEYGRDTNETGTFLYLTTDQVRFYPIAAGQRTAHAGGGGYHPGHQQTPDEPLPLEQIPPLVLSEILRDVDLFVGVSSVGNDPNWADGGPDGRYAEYWQGYSFGDLGATARTRKEVLERLVPRLKIAKQCAITDKFLVVKGTLRTYKIHLGSGNILMEPNDQYLCIVPNQAKADDGKLQLPFEGDRTLSIILSKAFLLSADDKIKDSTILSQIKRS